MMLTARAQPSQSDVYGVYVVGYTDGALPGQTNAGDYDVFLRKYDGNGNEVWTRQFGTEGADTGWGGVAVAQSHVYIGGMTRGVLDPASAPGGGPTGPFSPADAFVRMYDSEGDVVWTRQFGTAGAIDDVLGIAADSSGVYAVGETWGTLPGQVSAGWVDAFVRKFDQEGNTLWTRQFGLGSEDKATRVAAGPDGIYVTGLIGNISGLATSETFLRKYDLNGTEVWNRTFGEGEGAALAVTVHTSGVYVIGEILDPYGTFLRKYDLNGTEAWTCITLGSALAADDSGVIVAAPLGHQTSQEHGTLVREFDHHGNLLWNYSFSPPNSDRISGIVVGSAGVFVVGDPPFVAKLQVTLSNATGNNSAVSVTWLRQFATTPYEYTGGIAVAAEGPSRGSASDLLVPLAIVAPAVVLTVAALYFLRRRRKRSSTDVKAGRGKEV
jgi:hypothetical protein